MTSSRYPVIEGELEDELEFEWEGEEELSGEYLDHESGHEFDHESEDEWEGLVHELESEFELEEEDEDFDHEFEDEFHGELEYEDFADPSLRASRLGVAAEAELMAHLATQAAHAESEAEAEAFLGALIGPALRIGARLLPKALPAVRRVAPHLVRSVAKIGGQLWRHPGSRKLVGALPSVLLRTVGDLAGQWGDGQPITVRRAVGAFGRNVAGVLAGGSDGAAPAGRQSRARLARAVNHARRAGRVSPAARRAIHATHRLDHRFRTGGHHRRHRAAHHRRNHRGGHRYARR
jgi:hypothetical protein